MDFGNSLPFGGSVTIAGVIYVGTSLLVSGPFIGERMIELSGWDKQCQSIIHSELTANQPAPSFSPQISCNSILGMWMGSQGKAWCARYGDRLINPLGDQLNAQRRRVEELNRRRLSNAVSKTTSRCSCAANLALETNRTAFALHAGSIRLVNPSAVKHLQSTLVTALNAPLCSMKGAMR